MTVTEVIDYVKNIHNESGAQSSNWSDAELYKLIEAKCNEICAVIGPIEAKDETTVSVVDQEDYDFPTDFINIRRVWYDGIALKYLNFRQYEARRPGGVAPTGTPREFTIFNDQIILMPTPSVADDVITIWGEKKQPAITSAGVSIIIPSVFHYAICDAVIAQMFAKDLNQSMSDKYENKWLNFHIPSMKEYARRRKRRGISTTVLDADSLPGTENGII